MRADLSPLGRGDLSVDVRKVSWQGQSPYAAASFGMRYSAQSLLPSGSRR